MKIQYISCHAVLEYDEIKLLSELGFDIYANGCYRDPKGAYTLPRPGIPTAPFDQDFFNLTARYPKTDLPRELIDPFDTFIFMGGDNEQSLMRNWDRLKGKRVIWRSIGQNTPATERLLQKYRAEGLQIIRYSPKERGYDNYAGEDVLIRFYKDPDVYNGWVGSTNKIINFSQSLKGRGAFTHYEDIMGSMAGFNAKVYGSGNNDLGTFNGGEIPFDMMIETMREARVFVYSGTWPACYTLSIIEAMMMGMPVVAIGKGLAHLKQYEQFNFYEGDEIIENGESGFIGNNVLEMRNYISLLINDYELAKRISTKARERAITLFGKAEIAKQWSAFLKG